MYLLDTDTVIYTLNNDSRVLARFQAVEERPKAISVVTYGELLYGAMKSAQRERNLAKARRVGELFPVIEVSRAVIEVFASLKAALQRRGRPVEDFDLVIAATAVFLDYCLVTNNERHFRHIPGLRTENWAR